MAMVLAMHPRRRRSHRATAIAVAMPMLLTPMAMPMPQRPFHLSNTTPIAVELAAEVEVMPTEEVEEAAAWSAAARHNKNVVV
jgi:hypothetical protein